jgi:hypothetical protein
MAQADSDNSTSTGVQISDGLSELEEPVFRLRNLAYAIRMLASSDEMQKEPGAALDSLADTLVDGLNELIAERERLWHLSHELKYGPSASEVAES